jgi:hypothetical protein
MLSPGIVEKGKQRSDSRAKSTLKTLQLSARAGRVGLISSRTGKVLPDFDHLMIMTVRLNRLVQILQ